jgi:uncharacterized protein
MERPVKLRTVLHRRFEDERGNGYVYVTPSASVLALDPLAQRIVADFAHDGGTDPADWFARTGLDGDAKALLDDLVGMGVIRPVGEVKPPTADLPPMPFPMASLVLNVTNKCNLSCTYCYEYGADKVASPLEPGETRRARMTDDTARQSIDFLMRSSGDRPQVSVTFFGGETLLNFPAIRAATEHAEAQGRQWRKRVHFSLTTNATLLTDEVVDFLTQHRFGVTISIDGNQEDQDRHRRDGRGAGSFERIAPRIRAFVAMNKQRKGRPVGARVTLTRGASPVRETYRFLSGDLGCDEVGFAPVTAGEGRAWALDGDGYTALLAEFEALAADFVDAARRGEAHGFSNLNDLLRELHQGNNKAHPCGAGIGLLGVSTEGELGLCHRFVESKSHALGTIGAGIDEGRRSAFLRAAHVDKKTDCRVCFARPVCAGGCYHEAFVRYGDGTRANLHYCEWIRGWTDLGLRCYARIMAANPSFFARYESA